MKRFALLALSVMALALMGCLLQTPTPEPSPPVDVGGTSIPNTPTVPPPSTAKPAEETRGGVVFKTYSAPPLLTIDPSATYSASIRTTRGPIMIELLAAEAPVTVNSFLFLAGEGFYNGVIFHRVIPGFMIQGGDPTGTGTSGPGYSFPDEIVPSLVFDRPGILAMANAGPNTNGSQFFITLAPTPHLNGGHTIFGRVVEGQGVVEAISTVDTGPGDRPLQPVVIQGINITSSGGG